MLQLGLNEGSSKAGKNIAIVVSGSGAGLVPVIITIPVVSVQSRTQYRNVLYVSVVFNRRDKVTESCMIQGLFRYSSGSALIATYKNAIISAALITCHDLHDERPIRCCCLELVAFTAFAAVFITSFDVVHRCRKGKRA